MGTQTWVFEGDDWREASLDDRIEVRPPALIVNVEDDEFAWIDYRPQEQGHGPAFVGGSEFTNFRAGREADDAGREAQALAHWASLRAGAGDGVAATADQIRPLLFQEGGARTTDIHGDLGRLFAMLGVPPVPGRA